MLQQHRRFRLPEAAKHFVKGLIFWALIVFVGAIGAYFKANGRLSVIEAVLVTVGWFAFIMIVGLIVYYFIRSVQNED